MQPTCPKCGKYPFQIVQHECSAKESTGTPDILAELRARAIRRIEYCTDAKKRYVSAKDKIGSDICTARLQDFRMFIAWLDELAPPSDSTNQK